MTILNPRLGRSREGRLLAALLLYAFASAAAADNACTDFKWDVSQERALFATQPRQTQAGTDAPSAPRIAPGHLYAITLPDAEQVRFAVASGNSRPQPDGFAGIVKLTVPADGSYRIAVDSPVWIDVVAAGALLSVKDFQAQHDCRAPRKIVEFELRSKQPLLLQLSGAVREVLLTVSLSPARLR